MLLDQSKFRERSMKIKAILGLTDVDCKKIFTINRLENKEGAVSSAKCSSAGNDQRRVRCRRTKRMLHDLHHGAGGERSLETL